MQFIQTITVAGAGTMGRGIAQAIAQSGYTTILYDVHPEAIQHAQTQIADALMILIEKNRITPEEKTNILGRILFTSVLDDCRCDLVIEAVVEQIDIKQQLFEQLAMINSTTCIFATNTSSLSVTSIANGISNPSRVAGLHFFNPAPIMKLVEVVRTPYTTEPIVEKLIDFVRKLGKVPVICSDSPGFIVNHVARPYYLEALRLMEQGVDIELIDAVMEATGFKMGPFRLMDLIGNDINYAVSVSVYEALGQPARLTPSRIQKEFVEQGRLGRKSNQGFYTY